MSPAGRNIGESVLARLRTRSRETGERHELVQRRYAIERFLFRLGESPLADRFVLRGAALFVVWSEEPFRATRDLDLLGFGPSDPDSVVDAVRRICAEPVEDDGLEFLTDEMRVEAIRDTDEYGGVRVRFHAQVHTARVPVQIDIGFGDAVEPPPAEIVYPSLVLDSSPRVRAYCQETVVAEKVHAMVELGEANTRMKDFYDVFILAHRFPFRGETLARAIRATFDRRMTPLSTSSGSSPLAPAFYESGPRVDLWRRFLDKHELAGAQSDFTDVGEGIRGFVGPVVAALGGGEVLARGWEPGGPWR